MGWWSKTADREDGKTDTYSGKAGERQHNHTVTGPTAKTGVATPSGPVHYMRIGGKVQVDDNGGKGKR